MANRKLVWTGRAISLLVSLMFVMSAVMKLVGGPEVEKGMAHFGIPMSMLKPLGILELTCIVVYLIPATSVLGAILMAGYVGGIILTNWRVGEPVYIPILIGLLIWLGLYLREDRLKGLIPLRTV